MTATVFRYDAYDEPEQCAGAISGIAFHTIPCAAARFRTTTAVYRLGEARLVVVDASPNCTLAEVEADTAVVQVPLSGHDVYTINGASLRSADYFLYGPGARFERASTGSAATALLMLPPAMAEAALPEAAATLTTPRATAARRAEPGAWAALCRLVVAAGREPFAAADPEARRGLRDAFFEAFACLLMRCDNDDPVAHRQAVSRQLIVRRADAFLRENVARPIYTEELCAAVGVSPATLSAAFRATFGVSPHRFLKLRRLAMVRAALRAGEGGPMLVKSVALSHGFWHLGQFARDYHAAYGEKPSETLAAAA